MRLDKFLCDCGVGTRTEVKKMILSGIIRVDGQIVKSGKIHVDTEKNRISCGDDFLEYKEFRYYLMHKPAGYITATQDRNETVMDILPHWVILKDLFPVGRLDKDTEGLLLFTNNGAVAHDLLSPKRHVDKTYEVHLITEISDEDIKELEEGVTILDDYFTKEAKVKKIDEKTIELTITEGKYHQVKEMLRAVGNEVVYLKRLTFGKLSLGNLPKGEVVEVELEDII